MITKNNKLPPSEKKQELYNKNDADECSEISSTFSLQEIYQEMKENKPLFKGLFDTKQTIWKNK